MLAHLNKIITDAPDAETAKARCLAAVRSMSAQESTKSAALEHAMRVIANVHSARVQAVKDMLTTIMNNLSPEAQHLFTQTLTQLLTIAALDNPPEPGSKEVKVRTHEWENTAQGSLVRYSITPATVGLFEIAIERIQNATEWYKRNKA